MPPPKRAAEYKEGCASGRPGPRTEAVYPHKLLQLSRPCVAWGLRTFCCVCVALLRLTLPPPTIPRANAGDVNAALNILARFLAEQRGEEAPSHLLRRESAQ